MKPQRKLITDPIDTVYIGSTCAAVCWIVIIGFVVLQLVLSGKV